MEKVVVNRDALKKALPYGGIKEVAKRSKTSIYTVSKVIKGGSKNPSVIKALAEYIQELQANKERLNTLAEASL